MADKDRIKGKIEEIKGDVKQRIGGATKNRQTEAGGWVEEKKGQIRQKIADVKDEAERIRREEEAHRQARNDPEREP